jgi:neutral trehalase
MLRESQPPYLADMFIVLMKKVHDRQTRSHKYYLQIPNTKINTFALKGARLWNKLPAQICIVLKRLKVSKIN